MLYRNILFTYIDAYINININVNTYTYNYPISRLLNVAVIITQAHTHIHMSSIIRGAMPEKKREDFGEEGERRK